MVGKTFQEKLAAMTSRMAANNNAIEVEHIRKQFGEFVAVHDVSFAVSEGEIFGLLGPNGAGKTTTIRMMTTLTIPTSGTARVAGFYVLKKPDNVRNAIGVIPQAFTSDPDLTAYENMLIHCKLFGVAASERGALIARLLESVDLSAFSNSLVRTFSGGMRRRMEIARGLVHSPEIVFLDEPSTGLDPASRAKVWEMIRQLKEKSGLTVLLTTHYMEEADQLCDRIAIVDHGRLVVLDTPGRLKQSIPGTDVVEADFDGAPENWMEQLGKLRGALEVSVRNGLVHITSEDGTQTVADLMELSRKMQVSVKHVSVQHTTLDDVFLHYTGRQLRDAAHGGSTVDIGHLYQ